MLWHRLKQQHTVAESVDLAKVWWALTSPSQSQRICETRSSVGARTAITWLVSYAKEY